jgi:hypothetical protein
MQGPAQASATWEGYAWATGIVFDAHQQRMIASACISIVYATAFVVVLGGGVLVTSVAGYRLTTSR